MKSLTTRLLLLLAVCVFLAPLAHADDTEIRDNGFNVYPINNDKIRMVSEKVTISRTKSRGTLVECNFIFENTTDEELKIKIGFPTSIFYPGERHSVSLKHFTSYIDGQEAPVTKREEIVKKWNSYRYENGKEVPYEAHAKRYWYTWDVTFPPHARLNLKNNYRTGLSASSIGGSWFEYVLKTGANWQGTIGKAVIEAIYEDEDYFKRYVGRIKPDNYKIVGNKIVWEFIDFVPTENIKIVEISDRYIVNEFRADFIKLFKEKTYEGSERFYTVEDLMLYREFLQGKHVNEQLYDNIQRLYAQLMRNEIFARHGRKFKTNSVYMIFNPYGSELTWYKYNPNYSDVMLNNIERRNVQFILNYEEERGWR
jgi:hypothetical protein